MTYMRGKIGKKTAFIAGGSPNNINLVPRDGQAAASSSTV
jgi:hypothetical protein